MLVRGRITNTITGEVVPASGFDYSAPTGALGARVSMSLANPLTSAVPIGDALLVEIGLALPPAPPAPPVFSYVPVIAQGLIAGRSARYAWTQSKPIGRPGDTLQASALDALGDKWQIAPSRPVIMIDPDFVDAASVEVKPEDAIKEEGGVIPILPVIEPVGNLSLLDVINRAYTGSLPTLQAGTPAGRYADSRDVGTGLGFLRVVTNLPNYPVERVDFTQSGGWHSGALALYTIFEPIAYENENILYIWDTSKGLPQGAVARMLPMSCYVELEETTPPAEIVNAILLQYLTQVPKSGFSVTGAIPSRRTVHEDPVTGGEPNSPGYYRQEVEREIEEWKSLETGAILTTLEISKTTTNYAYRVTLNREVVTSKETLQISYQNGRKTGHSLTVEASYPNPNRPKTPETSLAAVYFETCQMTWSADLNNPGESNLVRTETNTRGSVLVEEENELREGETKKRKTLTPILEAARGNGIILDPDEQQDRDVTQSVIEDRRILTTIENFSDTGTGVAQMETIRTDHLKGVAYPPVIQTRPGSRSTQAGKSAAASIRTGRTVTELIKDAQSISRYGFRKAIPLSVGWLSAEEGRALARATLRRKAKPRRGVSITLPGIDLSVRRGSYFTGYTRKGETITFVVTGFSISAKALGTPNQTIRMSLEGLELV